MRLKTLIDRLSLVAQLAIKTDNYTTVSGNAADQNFLEYLRPYYGKQVMSIFAIDKDTYNITLE